MIVSLTGDIGVGKSTIAGVLRDDYGYVVFSWAKKLKKVAYESNPYVKLDIGVFMKLKELVDTVGWDVAKKNADVRSFLQRLGTEGCRNTLGEETFIDATLKEVNEAVRDNRDIVFDDTRFLNEAQAVKDLGGVCFTINRHGVKSEKSHESELGEARSLSDIELIDEGNAEDFAYSIDSFSKELLKAREKEQARTAYWEGIRKRSIEMAAELIVACACPLHVDTKRWKRRKSADVICEENSMSIELDGRLIGSIELVNGDLSIEAYLGK